MDQVEETRTTLEEIVIQSRTGMDPEMAMGKMIFSLDDSPSEKQSKPSKKEKRPRTPSPPPSSSSEDEDERRRRKKKQSKRKSKSKKRRRQRTPSPSSSSSSSSSDDSSGDEAPSPPPRAATASPTYEKTTPLDEVRETTANSKRNNDDDEVIGPMPLPDSSIASKSVSYGKDLLPGEGAAIAQFVQKNMRIPRRGEVGWSGNEIEQLESAGYVMSGSRHQRMNAIRIRKENQVYSAEEKRALALINIEEKQQRENNILAEFREMLTERLTKKHGSLVVEERQDQHQASIEKDT
ncbi:hypothetical protein Ae201684_008162 [Aphanomyces euteiches]|uniref:NF-kappa-B-activating protein C-terminal domain-containing protein n=1 Tax=Aphanomyces euteiches TaxID=100861 RepID=A0A6G0X5H9_9STRA|nr:hypothetical protein Ae201684_008162 [Aphanomyces euteiches]KAH9143202.1 hypothetical protein AeRB84_012779 [Aphanomyces euteiches]